MSLKRAWVLMGVVGFAAVVSVGQPSDKPATPKGEPPATPPATTPATGSEPGKSIDGSSDAKPTEPGDTAAAAKPTWPANKPKKLFATNDYRGRKAPELKVEKWLTKEPDRKGKVVLVDFWATWCPPCRALIPELNEWQKEFKDDLVIIGVSDEPESKVKPFMDKTKVEYAMAIDTRKNEMVKNQIGVQGIPHVLVIDSTGVCRWQGFPQSGEDTLTKDVLKQIIAADKAQRAAKTEGEGGGKK